MNSKKLLYALLFGAMFTSCAEVDICEKEHPHKGSVNFTYNWEKPADKPSRMGVLCYRILGQWKEMAEVNTDDLTLRPIGKPTITPEYRPDDTTEDGTTGDDTTGDGTTEDGTTGGGTTGDGTETPGTGSIPIDQSVPFKPAIDIPRGTYKFVTFPMDNPSIDYSEVQKFIETDAATYPLHKVGLRYKEYDINDPGLKKPLFWLDFNPYSKYIQPDVMPIYFDTTKIHELRSDQHLTLEFKPRVLSQNIDINFNIVKNTDEVQFYVTQVWAEISGIPTYINMSTGYLDITKTSKMLFKVDLSPRNPDADGNDTKNNKHIACHGNIDVTGVVNVQRAYGESLEDVHKKIHGPGIMQVVIYTSVYDPQTDSFFPQKWQGLINLYNTLDKAKLMTTTPDNKYVYRNGDHGTINITADILLDGKTIDNTNKGGDALDRWIQTDSDINIDI